MNIDKNKETGSVEKVYTFRVSLVNYEGIYRDISILGSQTFDDFHYAIFDAFDRWDEQSYKFTTKTDEIIDDFCGDKDSELDVEKTKIFRQKLEVGEHMTYLFDFADQWEHDIELLSIVPDDGKGDYPALVNSHGDSPAQYEENEDDDYEDDYDFTELTQKRYSVRKFLRDEVCKEDIDGILKVAHNAPTACNKQPQRIYVVKTAQGKDKIKRCTECHFNAPLFFVVCYDKNEAWHRSFDGQDYGMVDCSLSMMQMMLKVQELGLGSCFVAWFDPVKLRSELELPENIIPVGILPVGYPADDSIPNKMHTEKRPMTEMAIEM